MSFPFKNLGHLNTPFPGIPKGIETLIVPHLDTEMLFVSKVWAVAVLDYKARKKFLEQIIDSFGATFRRSVSAIFANWYAPRINAIRPVIFSKSIGCFTSNELHSIIKILDAYQSVRHVEYPIAGAAQSEYCRRLREGRPPRVSQNVAGDNVSTLAVDFLSALMEEKLVFAPQKPDPKHEREVRTFIIARFTPKLTPLLTEIDHIQEVIAFVFTPLGQKLSELEKSWHIALQDRIPYL